MNDIDYGQFITPRPDRFGSKMLYDTFRQLAEARRAREQAEMEDAQRRAASELTFKSSMYGHDVTKTHNEATQADADARRAEDIRNHDLAHGDRGAALEQAKQAAISTFLAKPEFVAALRSSDPDALTPFLPALQSHNITPADFQQALASQTLVTPPTPTEPPPLTPSQATGEPMPPQGPEPISVEQLTAMPTDAPPPPSTAQQFKGPGGLAFSFDAQMNALNQAKRASQIAGDVTAGAAGIKDPFVASATQDTGPMIRSLIANGIPREKAMEMATAAATARAGQASGRRNADVAGARTNYRESQGADRLELSKGTYARALAKDVLGQYKFSEVQAQNVKFNTMAQQLASSPNAAMDAVAAGTFVKMAQGGTGVISDSDMRVFWERIGGLGMKAETAIQGLIDGTLPADKRSAVLQAVKELARIANGNLNQIRGSLRTAMESDPNVTPEMRTSVLRTYGAMPSKAEAAMQSLLNKYAGGK